MIELKSNNNIKNYLVKKIVFFYNFYGDIMFTDSHCHIYKEYYEDINKVLEISNKAKVSRVISNGCDKKSCKEVFELSQKYDYYYCTLGIHPESVLEYTEEDIKYIEKNLNNPKVLAIGEIGLDYHYGKENREKQIQLFETQLSLAEKYNKPIVVHTRDAIEETYKILKKYNLKGVIHSFSGSLEMAHKFIKLGYVLGINGVITFKNCKLKDIYKEISLNNIVLETDSPYLTPEPYRGKQNNPSYIIDIAKFVSSIYNISLDDLAKVTNSNIKRIFDI